MKKSFNLLIALCMLCSVHSFAVTHMVMVSDFSFSPSTFSAQVGDTVMWMWSSGSHTTTSVSVPSGAASWDHPITQSSSSFNYRITVAGQYGYQCTPHASMGMVGGFTATGSSTGVAGLDKNGVTSLYPNPAGNSLHIDLTKLKGMAGIVITDATGRIARQTNAPGGTTFNMDTNQLPAGVYYLQIVAGNINEAHSFTVVH